MSDTWVKICVLEVVSINCYLVYNEGTKKAVIVGPADDAQLILNKRNELGIIPEAILLTHEHSDRIMAAEDVCCSLRIKIYASETEDAMLSDSDPSLSGGWVGKQTSFHADVLLKDGDEPELIGLWWEVAETLGHTTGFVRYYAPEEEAVFSGDTPLCESCGRTDLSTGSSSQMVSSLLDKVFILLDNIMVYPGYGDTTTIGHEKKNNPIAFYR